MGIFAGISGWFRYFRSGGGNGLPAPKAGALPTALHLDIVLCKSKAGALPVVVPDIFLVAKATSPAIDHYHSLGSLDSATGGGRLAPQLRYT